MSSEGDTLETKRTKLNNKLGHFRQKLPILGQLTEPNHRWRSASDSGVNVPEDETGEINNPWKAFLCADVTTLGWGHCARTLRTFPLWMWDKKCIIPVLWLCRSNPRHTFTMCTKAHHLIINIITVMDLFLVVSWRSNVELQAGFEPPGNRSVPPFTCSQLLPITTATPSKAPPQVTRAFSILFLALYSLHGSSIYSPRAFFFPFCHHINGHQSSGCVSLINKALSCSFTAPDSLKLGLWPEGGKTKKTS